MISLLSGKYTIEDFCFLESMIGILVWNIELCHDSCDECTHKRACTDIKNLGGFLSEMNKKGFTNEKK